MTPDPLREQLRSLPDLPPPAVLWSRLAHGQRLRRKRQRLLMGASVALVGLTIGFLHQFGEPLLSSPNTPRLSPSEASAEQVATRLRAIDHALQVAYAQGASDDELAPLWLVRQQLDSSISLSTNPSPGELL